MLLSLILYGSRARGDHRHKSDVDLLGITEAGAIGREPPVRGANLHLMSHLSFKAKCERGDLFACHIVKEGKALSYVGKFFASASESFIFKASYSKEIEEATLIALFISAHDRFDASDKKVRKRLFWAFRTLIIAASAEERVPSFGSRDLEEYSGITDLKAMIDQRTTLDREVTQKLFKLLVNKFGNEKVIGQWPTDKVQQCALLSNFSSIGKSTVDLLYPPVSNYSGLPHVYD